MKSNVLVLGLCCWSMVLQPQERNVAELSGSPAQVTSEPVSPAPVSSAPAAQDDAVPQVSRDKPMSFWMKHKLEYSKTLLESLTMGDFEQLEETAEQMRLLGRIEGFVRRKNPTYLVQLKNFELSMQELKRHAEHGNAEGATLAFNQMTTSCVACHSLLRQGID